MIGAWKQRVPWWAKVAIKIPLSRIPVPGRVWHRLNLFVHGAMDSPEYAYRVVRSHVNRAGLSDLSGRTVLELGPGDSLTTALIAKALHARRVYLVDAGAFADVDIARYQVAREYLVAQGLEPPDISSCSTVEEFLAACSAEYMAGGVADLRRIPAGSVDFVFSQAVLEHVKLLEFSDLLSELRRVMTPDGLSSHEVDLKDHLASALNSLRFPARVWESKLIADSGFYTNRLRMLEILQRLEAAGFSAEVVAVKRWDQLPTARTKLSAEFRSRPEEDLLVSEFNVLARPA